MNDKEKGQRYDYLLNKYKGIEREINMVPKLPLEETLQSLDSREYTPQNLTQINNLKHQLSLIAHCNPAAEDNWDQGECGTILTKQDSLELVEPDAIYYDTLMEYMDMDCGGSDEDVMWIGGNRDTIWE